ncbi:TBC1 domain family member 30-like isoform X2 [Limulus polyphemus]|uniref:TBC1 domain family member 30-like isoform X2 n=1 Tax=Limulus polyphemus TaxID=6850 RepID=A0ABM1BMX2_LIMPO|nr:TBC1 domain family member 30-like isoform X2 [Limulus polyphemus]
MSFSEIGTSKFQTQLSSEHNGNVAEFYEIPLNPPENVSEIPLENITSCSRYDHVANLGSPNSKVSSSSCDKNNKDAIRKVTSRNISFYGYVSHGKKSLDYTTVVNYEDSSDFKDETPTRAECECAPESLAFSVQQMDEARLRYLVKENASENSVRFNSSSCDVQLQSEDVEEDPTKPHFSQLSNIEEDPTESSFSQRFSQECSISSLNPPDLEHCIQKSLEDYQGLTLPVQTLPRERKSSLVEDLLHEIYGPLSPSDRRSSADSEHFTDGSVTDFTWAINHFMMGGEKGRRARYTRSSLLSKDVQDLKSIVKQLQNQTHHTNNSLVQQLKLRDRLMNRRNRNYDMLTAVLQAISPKRSVDTKIRFSVTPFPGDSGFTQWHDAMRMVARLPGGIPPEFRKRLWLTLADRHLQKRKIDWETTKRFCFNERTNPDDDRLGTQIIKDLHRTGCSMFSGEEAENNQALLKRVLLAYARWNKVVGYCQGFNMLAAIILEVMEWKDEDALKVMIFLIEGVLPEGYFANHLRGLSVDMAVFRDLLRMRLICLSRHLDKLQAEARDSSTGASYEPPLTNVFTMQWFLTLFSTCLPKSTVLQVWDLIFLEGNEILLRAALAIWDGLADRIMTVESADEFYSIMGVLTREMLEFGLMDPNDLVKTICTISPFPFPQLVDLRDKYTYNIRPFTSSLTQKRGLNLFFSDDEEDNDDEQLVMATWCLSGSLPVPKGKGDNSRTPSPSASTTFTLIGPGVFSTASGNLLPSPSSSNVNPERMTLDISALKKQYAKLRERQKQAHIILTGTFYQHNKAKQRQPIAVNHLLLGKKPLIRKQKQTTKTTFSLKDNLPKQNNVQRNRHRHLESSGSSKFSKRVDVVSEDSGQTLTWEQAKKEKRKHLVTMATARRQLLHNIPHTVEGKTTGVRRGEVDFVDSVAERDRLENGDSESSSSTELCDDEAPGDISDYSSPEMGRKASNSNVSNSPEATPSVETQQLSSMTRHFSHLPAKSEEKNTVVATTHLLMTPAMEESGETSVTSKQSSFDSNNKTLSEKCGIECDSDIFNQRKMNQQYNETNGRDTDHFRVEGFVSSLPAKTENAQSAPRLHAHETKPKYKPIQKETLLKLASTHTEKSRVSNEVYPTLSPVTPLTQTFSTILQKKDPILGPHGTKHKRSVSEEHVNVSHFVPNLSGAKEDVRKYRSISQSSERKFSPTRQEVEKLAVIESKSSSLPKEVTIEQWASSSYSSPKQSPTKSSQFNPFPTVRSRLARRPNKEFSGKLGKLNTEDKVKSEHKDFSNVVRPSRSFSSSEKH